MTNGQMDGLIDQRTDGQTKSFTELRTYPQLKSVIVWIEYDVRYWGGVGRTDQLLRTRLINVVYRCLIRTGALQRSKGVEKCILE